MNDTSLIDWAAVEADYRAGAHSLRMIAGAHQVPESTIRKRAAKHGWVRTTPGAQADTRPGAHSIQDGAHLKQEDGAHLIQNGEQTGAHDTLRTSEQVSTSVSTVSSSPDWEAATAGGNTKKENIKPGCSLDVGPARKQQPPDDPVTLELEYQEAQRKRGTHLNSCCLAASGGRCPQCLELTTQRDIAWERFRHAQYLR